VRLATRFDYMLEQQAFNYLDANTPLLSSSNQYIIILFYLSKKQTLCKILLRNPLV
jgi:hypothetical protein